MKIDNTGLQICTRCIFHEKIPSVEFNENGICNYCQMIDDLELEYKTGTPEGEAQLERIIHQIKRKGKGKKYDVVVGVSGGTDSSYTVVKSVEWGLRPLAVHYDNTWNSAIATENIRKVLGKLNIDLYTHVVDNKEIDDIILSFFKASVPDLDSPTDLALTEVLYRAAAKYNIKYIFEGHSFMAEGISPLSTCYIDGKYVETVQKMFGSYPIKTFPNMKFRTFMKWILIKKIQKIRPLWYINYSKEEAKEYLKKEFDWQYYGGHHLENRITAFHHSYYNPVKFGIDNRLNSLAASVRSGILSREEALEVSSQPLIMEEGLLTYFKKRLNLTDNEFDEIIQREQKTYRDYKTYKRLFERLRPFFYMLAKMNLVPMSFYIKYTSKNEI